MNGRTSAMAKGRPGTIAAVAALALLVAIVPFAVAGLRLDDLGRAVARARDLGIGALRTVLEATVLLAEPEQDGTGLAELLGASRDGPGMAQADRQPAAARDGLPDARRSLAPPASPAPPAPRPPAAGSGPGSEPDLAPPPEPEPPEEGGASLVDTIFALLEALPQLLPDAEAPHAPPSESAPPPPPQPVKPLVGPLVEPVIEATTSGLGPPAETAQAASEPVTDGIQAVQERATDPASSEETGLQAPTPVSGG